MTTMNTATTTAAHPIQWARPELLQGDVHAAAAAAIDMARATGIASTATVRAAAMDCADQLSRMGGAGCVRWADAYRIVAERALVAA